MENHDEKFLSHSKKIRANTELLEQHTKAHEDIKLFRESMIRQNEKIENRINKNRTQGQDDLNKVRDELTVRIDDLDKFQQDYSDQNNLKHNEAKLALKQEINTLREETLNAQKMEIDNLKNFVQIATEKVNTNNDGIYEKYDEKLKKIKDVCAQYFSKYERHLINHQTIVKDLERQQDQWVQMLIKPQELN